MQQLAQSALDPAAGSGADLIDGLGTVLYVGAGLIYVALVVLVLIGFFVEKRRIDARRWVIGAGLIFPALTLTALLIYSVAIGNSLVSVSGTHSRQDGVTRVHVIGKRWWWEIRYERSGAQPAVVLANELHIPVGRPVLISLSSADVIHSFWIPSLAGKVDMIPGRTTQIRLRSDEAGVFRGQCAEYCGGQHALMAFYVVAQSQQEFDAWLKRQTEPARVPDHPFLRSGYDAFFAGGCQKCHRVRGTPADADLGPDLTHVGSRRSLGAGILDNHIGTMAGWIAGAQDIKPGNAMPSAPVYSGRELRAVAAWLGSLE